MDPSPSKLLEEYKMKWTCKVNAGMLFFKTQILDISSCVLSPRWK